MDRTDSTRTEMRVEEKVHSRTQTAVPVVPLLPDYNISYAQRSGEARSRLSHPRHSISAPPPVLHLTSAETIPAPYNTPYNTGPSFSNHCIRNQSDPSHRLVSRITAHSPRRHSLRSVHTYTWAAASADPRSCSDRLYKRTQPHTSSSSVIHRHHSRPPRVSNQYSVLVIL